MATFWRCEGIAGASEHGLRLVRQGESCPRCGKTEQGEVPMREPGKEISAFDLINRFKFHPATEETGPKHAEVREACLALGEKLQELVPPGRELSTAITKLEETMMWANAGIARIPATAEKQKAQTPYEHITYEEAKRRTLDQDPHLIRRRTDSDGVRDYHTGVQAYWEVPGEGS